MNIPDNVTAMKSIHCTEDLRISEVNEVISPEKVHLELPITETAAQTTFDARQEIQRILSGQDDRLLVIVGPCSIHDPVAAREYAERLIEIRQELKDRLMIVMRVYFEKPRTTVGWKGLINDPDLDESFNINKGLRLARDLLLHINQSGLPAGTEYLDLVTPQYVSDLISWGAIGARTTESQVHRELASGLSCPVGFKNATDGTISVAVDAIRSARCAHHFLSLTKVGHSAIFSTRGNEDCHLILRGGQTPNFDAANIKQAASELKAAGLPEVIMVDFSHANSYKQHEKQMDVSKNVSDQLASGDVKIFGVMIESHLNPGNQKVVPNQELNYGQSITDACLGWEDTTQVLEQLAAAVVDRRKNR